MSYEDYQELTFTATWYKLGCSTTYLIKIMCKHFPSNKLFSPLNNNYALVLSGKVMGMSDVKKINSGLKFLYQKASFLGTN